MLLGTLRFATTDGWMRVARCLGEWIEYGALWRVVARKLKLSCYTTNYVLLEIAAVQFTLKMSLQKVRDELIYCFADEILDEEEFVLRYDCGKLTMHVQQMSCTVCYYFFNSKRFKWAWGVFLQCRTLVKRDTHHTGTYSSRAIFFDLPVDLKGCHFAPNSLKRERKRFRFTTQRLTSISKLHSKFNNFA